MFARLTAPAFASALALAAPAGAMDLTELTDAERAQFRAEVRAYLMENPEVILQAVEQMQNRQAEAQMQADFDLVTANADEIFDDGYSWPSTVRSPCPRCAAWAKALIWMSRRSKPRWTAMKSYRKSPRPAR